MVLRFQEKDYRLFQMKENKSKGLKENKVR